MRRALLTRVSKPNPLAGVNIGDSFMGGYYAGIVDTTKGNIIAADASQSGLRYALIISPESLQSGAVAYANSGTTIPTAAKTRWDGLSATAAMNSAPFPAAQYCAGLTHPSDTASSWYLPAMDELELAYRNLKPTTNANAVGQWSAGTFPGTAQPYGYNPSSDPTGAAYTTSVPGQTTVATFRHGGAQALDANTSLVALWAATMFNTTNSWVQWFTGSQTTSQQSPDTISDVSNVGVRPVRRLILT